MLFLACQRFLPQSLAFSHVLEKVKGDGQPWGSAPYPNTKAGQVQRVWLCGAAEILAVAAPAFPARLRSRAMGGYGAPPHTPTQKRGECRGFGSALRPSTAVPCFNVLSGVRNSVSGNAVRTLYRIRQAAGLLPMKASRRSGAMHAVQ